MPHASESNSSVAALAAEADGLIDRVLAIARFTVDSVHLLVRATDAVDRLAATPGPEAAAAVAGLRSRLAAAKAALCGTL
jgi:hypothetical protein